MWIRLAEHGESAAVDQEVEVVPAFGRDPPRDRQVRLGQQGRDPFVDELCLDRVLLVDEHFDLGRARGQGRERVDLVDQVGGQDQRRQHVAGADLVDRFGTVLTWTHSTREQIRSLDSRGRQLLPADADPRPGGDFVEEGDPRLLRAAEIAKPTRTAISTG